MTQADVVVTGTVLTVDDARPTAEALAVADGRIIAVDIRPVTIPKADDVIEAIRREAAERGPAGAYLNGWDPLLQSGLSADPRTVPPEQIADLDIRATYLAGRQVYQQ
jgi:predicted amidohydrolase YtcJ